MRHGSALFRLLVLVLAAPAVPANIVSGRWLGHFTTTMNPNQTLFLLDLKTSGSKPVGTLTFCGHDCGPPNSVSVTIKNTKLHGRNIFFRVETGEPDVPSLSFDGMVSGDSFNFTVSGMAPNCAPNTICQIGQGSATRTTSRH